MDTKKVMLVDDEVSLTRLLKLNLESDGNYEVLAINEGAKAFAAAKEFRPNIIFLDVIMPDMDGPSVAEALKEDPQLAEIPIVFMTAVVSREEAEKQSGFIGGNAFLAKPVDVNTVRACIEKHSLQ